MNEYIIKEKWAQLKGKAKEKWGELTNDDLDNHRKDKRDQLAGKIREKIWAAPKKKQKRKVTIGLNGSGLTISIRY